MESITRSVWGSHLQTAQMLGIPYDIKEFTTLNEKFNIQSGIAAAPDTYPRVRYICIGNGGHQMTVGADGIPLAKINQHKATDACLFKHLPFVIRQSDNDLTAGERENYALRKEVTYNSLPHIAYYLKRIDMTSVEAQLDYRTVNNGVETSTPYVPAAASLTPLPTVISNTGVNTVNGDYITPSAMVSISFTANDIAELLNVANIIYGDENYAIISEIGLCSGVDKMITVSPSVGGSFNFNEVIAVQIASFINAMHVAKYTTNGIDKYLDIGVNEAILNIM